jgi:hypothetical protein
MVRAGHALTASVSAILALSHGTVHAAATAPGTDTSVTMRWVDLQEDNASAEMLRTLWSDRLEIAARRWLKTPSHGKPLPAYALAHVFAAGERPVLVSILFNMYDCELPGNGAGADLYARCPMRIVTGGAGRARVTQVARACLLYVPEPANTNDGPDPRQSKTTVSLDRGGTLHLRVVQHGHAVPSCDMDLKLE